jgi:hypothetical protein
VEYKCGVPLKCVYRGVKSRFFVIETMLSVCIGKLLDLISIIYHRTLFLLIDKCIENNWVKYEGNRSCSLVKTILKNKPPSLRLV